MDSGIPAAGWYQDFEDPTQLRYWDGQAWTAHVQPPAAPPQLAQFGQPTQPVMRPTQPTQPESRWSEPQPSREPTSVAYPAWDYHTPSPARRVRPIPIVLTLVLLLAGFLGVRSALIHATDSVQPGLAQPEASSSTAPSAGGKTRKTGKVVLPHALTATQPAGQPVITPAGAKLVLQELWTARHNALTTYDQPAIRALDTGSALIGDLGGAECTCSFGDSYTESRVFVPRQVRYPAHFVTMAQTETSDGEALVVVMAFTRSSVKTSWQLSLATSFVPVEQLSDWSEPPTDAAGYASPPDASIRSVAEPMPQRLAEYYQAAKNTGRAPANPFKSNWWTTDLVTKIAAHRQDRAQANGLLAHFRFTVAPKDPLFLVLIGERDAMACGVVRVDVAYTGNHGRFPHQTADRLNWGPALAPGDYRSVSTTGVSQTCFFIPTTGGLATALGGDYRNESISSGVPLN